MCFKQKKFQVCEDAYKDNVKYLEIRFSPILHTEKGMSLSTVMESVVEAIQMIEWRYAMTVRIIVSGMRQLSPSITKDLAEIAWRYRYKG